MLAALTRRRLVGLVPVLVAGLVAAAAPSDDFSGHCVGDVEVSSGLADERPLDAVVTDPLHLTARVRTAEGPAPAVGTSVSVPGDVVPPPGTFGDVVAVGAESGGEVAVTVALRPLDQVGGFPGTPPMPTMTPGTRGVVTALGDPVGKTETLSVDSLRPPPARVPGPATVWYADDPDTGAMHPGTIVVSRIVAGRVLYTDPAGVIPTHTPGNIVPLVLPDRRCRPDGVLREGRVVVGGDRVESWP